ncbi:hypothetical protein R70723_24310 [Paenibacillus sp. FSL R7-0273]|uniref:hypothetical protein n=1 Tax=Paenibacillus sp. FSL R7-0273 TaxID=1536772 RepID=UPI0004F7332A|nr:hypothetical protein [Paenibacillus sp. FSL R7-0273]AIQ48681.1 hypothetical protein R70723_24310 [Paenibacillus sp. FSL R7-0273]OMF93973.1 hypothetical protein BK144_10265 [Paenibacillus sp. FSL R7-0273]
MATIIDVGSSTASTGSQTISIPILAPGANQILAEFGLSTVTGGSVLLNASIGFQTTLGVPSVVFTLYRDGQPIYNVGSSGLALLAIQPIALSFLDRSVPPGYHAYSLGIANNSLNILLNAASVTGPVTYSGVSIG